MSDTSAASLVSRLSDGWKASHAGPALELTHVLRAKLKSPIEVKYEGDDHLEFRMSLPNVRLRGADDIRGLIVGGVGKDAEEAIRYFGSQLGVPGRIYMVLAGSIEVSAIASGKLPAGSALIVSPDLLTKLTAPDGSVAILKAELRKQLGRRKLLPFDIEHPAPSNMFFGRNSELNILGGSSSVAIVGPGRIGKTSLLLEHRRRLTRSLDARMHTTFFVDFYPIADKSSNGVAKYLAMKLNPTRKSSLLTAEDLMHFLRSEKARLGVPGEFLLDEVDEVIAVGVFSTLAMAAREGLCRLVLCGKSVLFEQIYHRKSPLASRLELVRPKPLTNEESVDLLLQPFQDLGYVIRDQQSLCDGILELTGGLPQHIQFLGGRLFQILEEIDKTVLDSEDLKTVKADFEFGHYMRATFTNIEAKLRPVAFALLRQRSQAFDAVIIQDAFKLCSITVPPLLEAADIGDSLVISNFLVWAGRGSYRVACPAMADLVSPN